MQLKRRYRTVRIIEKKKTKSNDTGTVRYGIVPYDKTHYYLILQMFHFIFFQFVLTLSRTFTFLWNQTYPVHSTYIHLFVPSYSTGG